MSVNGCINVRLWSKSAGKGISVDELMHTLTAEDGITGVTYIGGEPLEQGADLLTLSERIIAAGLDIVLFTGYEPSEFNALQKQIADRAVVIISGRYDQTKRDTFLVHRGSSNQTISIKDEKLHPFYADECRQVEIEITTDGEKYLGFPVQILRKFGYSKIVVSVSFDAKEIDDGYQDLWIRKTDNTELAYQKFEHSPGEKKTSWKTLNSKSYTFNIDVLDSEGKLKLEWGANGTGNDNWWLGHTVVTISVVK